MARYFVKEYSGEDAEDMVELVRETISVVNKAVGKKK